MEFPAAEWNIDDDQWSVECEGVRRRHMCSIEKRLHGRGKSVVKRFSARLSLLSLEVTVCESAVAIGP